MDLSSLQLTLCTVFGQRIWSKYLSDFQNASMSSVEELININQTRHQLGLAKAAAPNGTGTEKEKSTLTVIGCGKSLLYHHFSLSDFDMT